MPPYSPDLNPIENAWWLLKYTVGTTLEIYSMNDLATSLKRISAKRDQVTKAVSATTCKTYADSFMRRIMHA
jgi:transposase